MFFPSKSEQETAASPEMAVCPLDMDAVCPDACGQMPSCAPLAVPYVPFQKASSQRYNQNDALNNGTLFPGLNLPFHLKVEAANVVSGPLAELQALAFVLSELALYLDTHQDDAEAFALFQQYAALEKEGKEKYEAAYGPICLASVASQDSFASWLRDPWPWEYKKGGKQ